jgi:hypothetical protein
MYTLVLVLLIDSSICRSSTHLSILKAVNLKHISELLFFLLYLSCLLLRNFFAVLGMTGKNISWPVYSMSQPLPGRTEKNYEILSHSGLTS